MLRLKKIIEDSYKKKLLEADEEAPAENNETDDPMADDTDIPVEGADEANDAAGDEETDNTDETDETNAETDDENDETDENDITTDVESNPEEDFEDVDKTIEEMVGITEIQHTTSSTILDFEDGGQIMYVQPMVSVKSETLNKIISLIEDDVEKTYANQKDEITGKQLSKTKYWKSIKTLISTMVRSQLTKSDNVDGLIDEIKQIFKVLEVK